MISLNVHQNNNIDSDRHRAIATARMVNYAATDASDLGLKECSQLLYFVSCLIKAKYNIRNDEALFE
jgi:hypothetical protein